MSALTQTLMGNMKAPAVLRQAGTKLIAVFTIVVSEFIGNGETVDTWIDCKIWNEALAAELVLNASTFKAGTKVIVVGSFRQEKWESKDGAKHNDLVFRTTDIAPVLRPKAKAEAAPAAKAPAARKPKAAAKKAAAPAGDAVLQAQLLTMMAKMPELAASLGLAAAGVKEEDFGS